MKKNLTLTIPEPCSEDWNKFTRTQGGRFCASCSKVVIDFTKASDSEIVDFFKIAPRHTCGRFRVDQLKAYSLTPVPRIRPGFMVIKAGFLSLLLLVISRQGSAQTLRSGANVGIVDSLVSNAGSNSKHAGRVIRGIVRSEEDDLPLPGTNVFLKGTLQGTATDSAGRFELPVQMNNNYTLVFTFVGFTTKELKVPAGTDSVVSVLMKLEGSVSGGLIVMTGAVANNHGFEDSESFLQKFWHKVKRIF